MRLKLYPDCVFSKLFVKDRFYFQSLTYLTHNHMLSAFCLLHYMLTDKSIGNSSSQIFSLIMWCSVDKSFSHLRKCSGLELLFLEELLQLLFSCCFFLLHQLPGSLGNSPAIWLWHGGTIWPPRSRFQILPVFFSCPKEGRGNLACFPAPHNTKGKEA